LVRRPRGRAVGGLRRRCPLERRVHGGGELIPEGHVLRLLARVLLVAGGRGRTSERDDRVPILAGVESEPFARQLAAFPSLVERVLQDVPALLGLVDPRAKLHLSPLVGRDPGRDPNYSSTSAGHRGNLAE